MEVITMIKMISLLSKAFGCITGNRNCFWCRLDILCHMVDCDATSRDRTTKLQKTVKSVI